MKAVTGRIEAKSPGTDFWRPWDRNQYTDLNSEIQHLRDQYPEYEFREEAIDEDGED